MIKNYTTEVAEEKTVGEIMGLLAAKGARSIRIDYDERNRPTGIGFMILVNGCFPIPFKLPCNFDGVFKAMFPKGSYKYGSSEEIRRERARKVAWRIIKDWVAAQMALIEAEQASLAQVFFPYAVANEQGGATAFDQFIEQISTQKSLPGKSL